jgi:hypothetical protein
MRYNFGEGSGGEDIINLKSTCRNKEIKLGFAFKNLF